MEQLYINRFKIIPNAYLRENRLYTILSIRVRGKSNVLVQNYFLYVVLCAMVERIKFIRNLNLIN
jgi:hypothetical protein